VKDELAVLKDLVQRLESIKINYMLTGSLAMMHYGVPRMTRDLDVVIEINDVDDVDKMVAAFSGYYYIDREMIKQSLKTQTIFNIVHNESVIKVDFIVKKRDRYRELEFSRRKRIEIDGIKVDVVSKEDLILSKLVWIKDMRSELQVNDVKNLCKSNYDSNYIEHWAERLSVKQLFDEVVRA